MRTKKISRGDGYRLHGIVRVHSLSAGLAERGAPVLGALARQARREGEMVQVLEHHNLVVDQGMEAIAKFLGGGKGAPTAGGSTFDTIQDLVVTTMQLGVAASPPSPAAGDTTGVGSLVYQPPITVSYPTPYSVMFSGVLPITEAIGQVITEEALLLANGKVFAKATFAQAKTGAAALQFDHQIVFARS